MKLHEEIKREIEYLKKLKREWASTRKDKIEAQSLSTKVYIFSQSIESIYSDFLDEKYSDNYSKTLFIDSLRKLNLYYMSKNKIKDDDYFYEGIDDANMGINQIISSLENLLN